MMWQEEVGQAFAGNQNFQENDSGNHSAMCHSVAVFQPYMRREVAP